MVRNLNLTLQDLVAQIQMRHYAQTVNITKGLVVIIQGNEKNETQEVLMLLRRHGKDSVRVHD